MLCGSKGRLGLMLADILEGCSSGWSSKYWRSRRRRCIDECAWRCRPLRGRGDYERHGPVEEEEDGLACCL